jgi:hypothetical protein
MFKRLIIGVPSDKSSMSTSPTLERTYSETFVSGKTDYDLFQNKNVEWMSFGPFFQVFYIIFVVVVWFVLHTSRFFSVEDSWTAINVLHGVVSHDFLLILRIADAMRCDVQVTFVIFHWVKGSPDANNQGEYNAMTLYEQIDAGVPWTNTKKFLMLVPTIMTWIACHESNYKPIYIIVNCGLFLILIIAKLPQMHGVRILGINSTPGFDTPAGNISREEKNR